MDKKRKNKERRLNLLRVRKDVTPSDVERNSHAYTHRFIYVNTIFISDYKETRVCHIEKRSKKKENDTKMKGTHADTHTYKCISICSKIFIRGIYPMDDQHREIRCNNLLTFSRRTKRLPFLPLSPPPNFPVHFLFNFPSFILPVILWIVNCLSTVIWDFFGVSFASFQVERNQCFNRQTITLKMTILYMILLNEIVNQRIYLIMLLIERRGLLKEKKQKELVRK